MVYINIVQDGVYVTLNCNKGSQNGEYFKLIIDSRTKEVIERPISADMDASIAYAHIYAMMRDGIELPKHTVAAWG